MKEPSTKRDKHPMACNVLTLVCQRASMRRQQPCFAHVASRPLDYGILIFPSKTANSPAFQGRVSARNSKVIAMKCPQWLMKRNRTMGSETYSARSVHWKWGSYISHWIWNPKDGGCERYEPTWTISFRESKAIGLASYCVQNIMGLGFKTHLLALPRSHCVFEECGGNDSIN